MKKKNTFIVLHYLNEQNITRPTCYFAQLVPPLAKTGRGVPSCLLRGSIILRVNKYTWSRCLQSGPSGQATLDWNNIPPNHTGENPCGGPWQKHSSLAEEIFAPTCRSTSFLLIGRLLLLHAKSKVFKNIPKTLL